MRKLFGLSVLLAILGVFAVSTSVAGASEVPSSEGSGAAVVQPATPETITQEQECYFYGWMCAWQGDEWGGEWSHWPGSETGCHNHAANPNLRSFLNKTAYNVRIGGWGVLQAGLGLQMPNGEVITGELCWPA